MRHAPDKAGLVLDPEGWASVGPILNALARAGYPTSEEELRALVARNDKQRFELSSDGRSIRARQGHSVEVAGDWPLADPPDTLFHGTVERFLPAILRQGLQSGRRHHVHLSATRETALAVGARRGPPILLAVAARRMVQDGYAFYLASNGVWLTTHVPPTYLTRLD